MQRGQFVPIPKEEHGVTQKQDASCQGGIGELRPQKNQVSPNYVVLWLDTAMCKPCNKLTPIGQLKK